MIVIGYEIIILYYYYKISRRISYIIKNWPLNVVMLKKKLYYYSCYGDESASERWHQTKHSKSKSFIVQVTTSLYEVNSSFSIFTYINCFQYLTTIKQINFSPTFFIQNKNPWILLSWVRYYGLWAVVLCMLRQFVLFLPIQLIIRYVWPYGQYKVHLYNLPAIYTMKISS